MKKHYQLFDKYIFRTPLYPLDYENEYDKFIDSNCFNEAILLGSPELYLEKAKASQKNTVDEKLENTLNKYFSRSFFRCTPFGLFAGCSVGAWGHNNIIKLESQDKYKRTTRLDMNFICATIQFLEKNETIRHKLTYYPNDSIYEIGGKLRYIEYYYRGTKRIHQLTSIDNSEYLTKTLNCAKKGATINDLVQHLMEPDISKEEALDFVIELIDAQVLISQLQVQVTGNNPLTVLIENLESINEEEISPLLRQTRDILNEIDNKPIGTTIDDYEKIVDVVKQTNIPYERKFLFQSDMFKPTIEANLAENIQDEINEIISFLNVFSSPINKTNISRFAEAFSSRFDEMEIPLAVALDIELGLGYPIEKENTGDVNNLVDNLFTHNTESQNNLISFTNTDSILLKKYIDCIKREETVINIDKEDIKQHNKDISDLPETLSFMCKIFFTDENIPIIFTEAIGGACAANLLARFCHLDSEIYNIVKSITQKELESNPNSIVAEISHLPESRIGNISHRPLIREYEIHYLAQSGVDKDFQIDIEDLMISVQSGKIVLRSKKFDKEVIPRLTNAHNYSSNSMPIYNFLCDIQYQNIKPGLFFQWGEIFRQFDYLPRVCYKKHILTRAQWAVNGSEIKEFNNLNDEELITKIQQFQKVRKIPDQIIIPDGDNELYINLKDIKGIRMMLAHIKLRTRFIVKESLSELDNFITSDEGKFTNEFIIPLYKI